MGLVIKDSNITELKVRLEELLHQKDIEFRRMKPSNIPEKAGVYVISDGFDEPLYIGRTKNLRQRLYNNHLMGKRNNARLKNYLLNSGFVRNEKEAKQFILQNCKVRWIFEDDYRKRGFLEGYVKNHMPDICGMILPHPCGS